MRDDDALRAARRTGGVHDVRRVGRVRGTEPVGVGERGVLVPRHVHGGQVRAVQHADRGSVGEHVGDAVGRVADVHRQIRRTRLDDREQADEEVHRAGGGEGHQLAGARAPVDEVAGQPVGPRVQFPVRDLLALQHEGDPVGCADRLGVEQLGQDRGGQFEIRGVPRLDDLFPLGGQGHVDAADEKVGVGGDGFEDLEEPGGDTGALRSVELLRTDVEPDDETVSRDAGDEAERVVGRAAALDVGDSELPRRALRRVLEGIVLEDEDRVEELSQTYRPLDLGEADVVVVEQVGLPALEITDDLGERRGRLQPDADRERVDEGPDHGLDAGQVGRAPGDRGAEDDVAAAGELPEHHRPGALHQVVHGQAAVGRHPDQAGRGPGR